MKPVALQPRPFSPVSKNKYPPHITGDPSGIVKRKAGRDNSVGVERGFRARGEMAHWPNAHMYPQRESARLAKENNWTLLLACVRYTFLLQMDIWDDSDKFVSSLTTAATISLK